MFYRFILDKYSTLKQFDVLTEYLSQRMVNHLSLQKTGTTYTIEYSTTVEPMKDKNIYFLQDDIHEFKIAYLMDKVDDYYIFYDHDENVYVCNKYGVDTSKIDSQDEILEVLEHIRKAVALLEEVKVHNDYTSLFTQVTGSRKYIKSTLRVALDTLHDDICNGYSLASDKTIVSENTIVGE